MPCNSIVSIGVNLNLANKELLLQALEKIGAQYLPNASATISFRIEGNYYYMQDGKLNGTRNVQAVADKLKVAYTREAVAKAAQRVGWTVESKAENKLAIQRRY